MRMKVSTQKMKIFPHKPRGGVRASNAFFVWVALSRFHLSVTSVMAISYFHCFLWSSSFYFPQLRFFFGCFSCAVLLSR